MRDDETVVRSVLHDLTYPGLVRRDGNDDSARVEAVDIGAVADAAQPGSLDAMVLVALHRTGPAASASGVASATAMFAAPTSRSGCAST